MKEIEDNLQRVWSRIDRATEKSGRSRDSICLVAVCKKQPFEKILAAVESGVTDLAENYPEQGIAKIAATKNAGTIWHMIGHVQSRKIPIVADNFQVVHSIDSFAKLQKLDSLLVGKGKYINCFLEINLAGETSKSGFIINKEEELALLDQGIQQAKNYQNARIRGLMLMPPYTTIPEESRPFFRQARKYLDVLQIKHPEMNLEYLSMGTSQDYEIAIQEGATHVRIGTAIFGER